MLWAYIDETGLNPTAKRLTVGGLIGRKLDWQRLEPRWRRRLPRPLAPFHTQHCARGHKAYKGICEEERLRLYDDLAGLASAYKFGIVSGSIDLDAWRKVPKPAHFTERFPTAYSLCFEICLSTINSIGANNKRRVAVSYAINEQFGERAEFIGQAYKSSQHHAEWIMSCAPNTPANLIPLQVADMICYEIYHQKQSEGDPDGPPTRLMSRLVPEHIGHYYDETSLRELIAQRPSGLIS